VLAATFGLDIMTTTHQVLMIEDDDYAFVPAPSDIVNFYTSPSRVNQVQFVDFNVKIPFSKSSYTINARNNLINNNHKKNLNFY
jgi:hypothetical protein